MRSVAALLALAACASAAPYHANLAGALAPYEKAKSPSVLMLGDSLTMRDGGPYAPLRAAIQADRGDGGAGWQSMSRWTGGGFDPGWLEGQVNADTSPHMGLDGLWASTGGTPWARLDPAPGTKRMRFVVNGTGSFGLWNTATNQTTQHQAPGVFEVEFPGSAGRVWVQPAGTGQVTVLGANCGNGQQGARVSRGANGGWGVANFLQRDGTFEQVAAEVAPDLVWVTLGQNDQGYPRAAYAAAMAQLVQRVRAAAPQAGVVLCASYDSGSPAIATLADAVYDAAAQEGVGFVNLWAAGGPYGHFQASGYLDDGVHFSPAGGAYVAGILYDAIRSRGASLRWCPGDANQDGATNGADLSVVLATFGQEGLPWGPGGDLNGDGSVDGADLSVALGGFGCQR